MTNKRKGGRRQARRINLSAASLAVGSPELGVPTLGQHHSLRASALETSSPEMKPAAKRVHHLETDDSTVKRKRRGRPPKLTAAQRADLQAKLDKWWTQKPSRKQNDAVAFVKDFFDASDQLIEREIVRPVYKKLKRQK
jgi:hypothetical protein